MISNYKSFVYGQLVVQQLVVAGLSCVIPCHPQLQSAVNLMVVHRTNAHANLYRELLYMGCRYKNNFSPQQFDEEYTACLARVPKVRTLRAIVSIRHFYNNFKYFPFFRLNLVYFANLLLNLHYLLLTYD